MLGGQNQYLEMRANYGENNNNSHYQRKVCVDH